MSVDQIVQLIQSAIQFGTVILFGAMGEILTEKSGNLNLGVPGIMYLGGFAGFASAYYYEKLSANPSAFVCVILALLCALAFDQGIHLGAATPSVWMSILYLALFCTVAGYLLQNAALGVLSSRTVALLQCFCPVMTAMFSRLLLGEQLSTPGILGAVIILLCVAAETMMKDDKPLS